MHGRPLVLPNYDTKDQLEGVREQARRGELVCPTCRQFLWLCAGDQRLKAGLPYSIGVELFRVGTETVYQS